MDSQTPTQKSISSISTSLFHTTTGIVVSLLGILVLVGWHINIKALIQVLPAFVPMQYNTALGFLLCGIGLLCFFISRKLSFISGIIVFLLGSLTLSQYIFGYNLGIDEILMKAYITVNTSHPGRMAPNSALCFILTGIALILHINIAKKGFWSLSVALLGAIVTNLGMIALIGYLTEMPTVYGWGQHTQMAVHTSLGFFFVGSGLIARAWQESGTEKFESSFWLPSMVFVTSITITLCLAQTLHSWEQNNLQNIFQNNQGLENLNSSTDEAVLIFGFLVSVLFAMTIYLAQQERRRAKEAVLVNNELKLEIEERSRIARVLVENNIFKNAIFNGANYMIISTDVDGTILGFNKTAERCLGYMAEEVVGKVTPAIIHDTDEIVKRAEELTEELGTKIEPGFEAFVAKARLGEADERQWTYIRKDGTRFPIRLSVTALHNEDGELKGFLGIGNDITERLKMAAEQKRLTAIVEASGDFILGADLGGKVNYINKAGRKMVGIDEDKDLSDRLIPEFHPQWAAERIMLLGIPTAMRKGIWVGETALLSENGDEIPVSQMILAHKDENGKVKYLSTVARDIAQQKENETALRASEQHNRDLIENTLGFICTHSLEGIILSINPAMANALEYTPREMVGKKLFDFVDPEARNLFDSYMWQIRQNREMSGTLRFICKSGEKRLWEFNNSLYEKEGSEPYVLCHAFDITDRKRIEAKLRAAHDAALESARIKSEFLANMSHEIRTPMNGIIGMTDILLDTELEETQKEYAGTIKSSADALMNIINDILDFSKIEAGKLKFETIDFNLRRTVENTIQLFAEQVADKNLEIASLVSDGVQVALRGDPGRLRQVLVNLIGNAVKFTEQGEIFIRVDKLSETDKDIVLNFSVKDTGIGIEADVQNNLFQAFTQADGSMTRRFGGTGLGLTISKQLVEMMGGDIKVESEIGKGSTFSFTAHFEKQSAEEPQKLEMREDLETLRVLIVDDNATNRRILVEQIKTLDVFANEAESGKDALDILRKAAFEGKRYDLAILDLMMPEMDGFELAEKIRAETEISDIRLILMPSHGKRGHANIAKESGIDGYLIKPIKQADLFDCIAAVTSETKNYSNKETPMDKQFITQHTVTENREYRKEQILVAEDNIVNQKLIKIQLERIGFKADIAANGIEAIEALEKKDYSLILMDCQMPKMDGYAASAEIRRNETDSHIPIIAITANAMEGEREKCLAAGMDDFLTKPFKQEELVKLIEYWLEKFTASIQKNIATGEDSSAPSNIYENTSKNDPSDDLKMRLSELEAEVGGEILGDIISLFIEDSQSRFTGLKKLAEGNEVNFSQIRREAHGLKGSSANVGAQYVRGLCLKLEIEAEAGNMEKVVSLINEIEESLSYVFNALEIIKKEYSVDLVSV